MHDIVHDIAHDAISVAAFDLDSRLNLAVVGAHKEFLSQNASDLKHGDLILAFLVIDAEQKLSLDLR